MQLRLLRVSRVALFGSASSLRHKVEVGLVVNVGVLVVAVGLFFSGFSLHVEDFVNHDRFCSRPQKGCALPVTVTRVSVYRPFRV